MSKLSMKKAKNTNKISYLVGFFLVFFFVNNANFYVQLGVVQYFWKNQTQSCLRCCLFFLREKVNAVSCAQLSNFNFITFQMYFFSSKQLQCKFHLNKSHSLQFQSTRVKLSIFLRLEDCLASCLVFARFQPGCYEYCRFQPGCYEYCLQQDYVCIIILSR